MAAIADRITVNPERCGGRSCIRGMRIRVASGDRSVILSIDAQLSPHLARWIHDLFPIQTV